MCDVDFITRKFFCASNCIFAYSSSLLEILQLHLQQSFCLPILQYVNGALRFNQQQMKALYVCWNSIFRKNFRFNRSESVSQFINGLGYLNFTSMYYMCAFKFVKSALCLSKNVLSRLANLNIKCSDFGHQSSLMNVQMDMLNNMS